MILNLGKKRPLVDRKPPVAPYYLAAEDLFIKINDKEIFLKHIFTTSKNIRKLGPVIMSPGVSSNANLFRLDDKGDWLSLEHNQSFANLLASEGFDVFLHHPGYSDRVHNRYVSRHCPQSINYKKRYRVSPKYSYGDLVNVEVPTVIDYVCDFCRAKNVSWIGYSLGGMIAYSYLAKNRIGMERRLSERRAKKRRDSSSSE